MNASRYDAPNRIQVESAAGLLAVDDVVLGAMKTALLAYFNQPAAAFPAPFLEVRGAFAQELSTAAVWIREGIAHIGPWRLESHAGQLVLVRYPPPIAGTMYLFRATLKPEGTGWAVMAFDVERELGPE